MGHVEHRHCYLIDTIIAMLSQAHLLNNLWDFGLLTTCYLCNRNPTPLLTRKSPLQALFGRISEYNKLRVFESLCYPYLQPYKNNKLEPKSKPCVFISYSMNQDCYLCLDPASRRIFFSRDVSFKEMDLSLNIKLFEDPSCNAIGDGR